MSTQFAEPAEIAGSSQATISLGHSGGHGAPGDLQPSTELLNYVATTAGAARFIRVYRLAPTLESSRRESHLPGFDAALTLAASYGFVPVDSTNRRRSRIVRSVLSGH